MARTVRDARLDTRTARAKLAARHEPHWRAIDAGMHLGYRRGPRKAAWIARFLTRKSRYLKKSLGIADDTQDADGVVILSFSEAQEKARSWFQTQIRAERGLPASGRYTVADVLDDYFADYEQRGGKSLTDVRHRIDTLIRPRLGNEAAADLTAQEIRAWHRKLASEPPRVRSKTKGKGAGVVKYRDTSNDPDATRKRRHSANKVFTILKAALNHAFGENKIASDEAWRRVKPFQDVDVPRVRFLDHDECVRLVNASALDFRKLVRAALYAGCRYGEIIRFRVGDFNPEAGTVQVRESKSGKPRHVVLTVEGQEFFKNETAGRAGDKTLFLREDGEPWGASHQQRPLADACSKAKITPAASFHVLRHTYASSLVMNGVPLGVVAVNLGHADTRITERHYAHLAPSYVADAIRAGARELGFTNETNVESLRRTPASKKQARRG